MDIERQLGVFGGVRGRLRDLDPLVSANDNTAYALYVSLSPATPLGHLRHTITNTPVALEDIPDWPTGVKKVHIYNLSTETDVFFTDLAGQSPSAALGFPIKADSWFVLDNDVDAANTELATVSGTASLCFACYA